MSLLQPLNSIQKCGELADVEMFYLSLLLTVTSTTCILFVSTAPLVSIIVSVSFS